MDLADRWKIGVSIADIAIKSAIALALGYLGVVQNTASENARQADRAAQEERERFNRETACWTVIRDTMAFIATNGKTLTGDQITDLRALLPDSCGVGPRPPGAPNGGASKSERLSALLLALLPSPPVGSPAQPPSTRPDSAAEAWVAVGFLNTPDFNFTRANGAAISTMPKDGDVLRARWSVNIRPGAAAWGQSSGVLGEGRCFKVARTKALSAGGLSQAWAQGSIVDCPAS
ncbi:hypothetical protein V5F53_12575 [Xanthobacter sp. V4C-4]|uniref:hypothetical protein n=1 Tax=Xanthobacter cornucopiae TaxID=3119924 RepID=UPI00372A06C5